MHRTRVAAAMLTVVGLFAGCDDKPVAAPTPLPTIKAVDYSRWAAGRSTPLADPIFPTRGNPDLDVLHYGLKLTWEPATQTLTGHATLQIRPTTNASQIVLDFKPYHLDRVHVDTRTVAKAAVQGEKLVVPVAVIADQPVTLAVAYHGKPATTPLPSHRGDAEPLGLTITKDGGL